MEQQALALKYRPMDFDELVGQEAVSRTLSLALQSRRLSHAYLFSGLRGSGKTSSARIFARALQCDSGPCAKPCGVCPNCVAANPHKMSHIDIMELDGASNRKIDDIRDLIEQTKYHPNLGRFKIFIIDEVHMLTREAFNALLKTLEEPPEYVKFILATTDPLKLPATILSRTQHFRFKRISDKQIFAHLKKILHHEKIPYEEEALEMLIRSGSGSLRDTLTLLDQSIIYSNYNITADVCASMLGLINTEGLNLLFESIFAQDREALLGRLEGFFEYECGMLLDEMGIFLKEKLLRGDDARYTSLLVDRFFRIITQSKELLFLGAENAFVLTLSVFKMQEALKIESIDAAIAHLEKGVFASLPKVEDSTQSEIKDAVKVIPLESRSIKPQLDSPQGHTQELFALLGEKISAHNYDLGEIFAKDVRLISYEDSVLTWETSAVGKNRERLIAAYSIIKNYVLEVFGMQTQIKNISARGNEVGKTPQHPYNAESKEAHQEASQTEEPSECLDSTQQAKQEVAKALQTPILKSAQELLDIKQIKVRPITTGLGMH